MYESKEIYLVFLFNVDMRMHSTDLSRTLTIWLLISGGRGLYIVFYPLLHIPLHGHGSNVAEERSYKDCGNLLGQSMIILACVLVGHVLSMKDLRLVCL